MPQRTGRARQANKPIANSYIGNANKDGATVSTLNSRVKYRSLQMTRSQSDRHMPGMIWGPRIMPS